MSKKYTDRNVPPPGYTIVTYGSVSKKDYVWNDFDKCWKHPTDEDFAHGDPKNITHWYCVAKKLKTIDEDCQWWGEIAQKLKWDLYGWTFRISGSFFDRENGMITLTYGQACDIRKAIGMEN